MKKMTVDMIAIIKIVCILAGVVGGIVGVGDRLYAKKEVVAVMQSEMRVIKKDVNFIADIFRDAQEAAIKKRIEEGE